MRPVLVLAAVLLATALGVGGYLAWQDGLVPVSLGDGRALYVPAAPEFQEDAARLAVLLPAGPGVEALLVATLEVSRHGRRWRLTVRSGWRLQDGTTLDANRVLQAIGPAAGRLGGQGRVLDAATLELRFQAPPTDLPEALRHWRVPGSGPFVRRGTTLTRFEGFPLGRAGIAALTVVTDPALLESRTWAAGLASRRWAWAAFPGGVAPGDMAKARLAPCDELRLQDGSIWFLSRRLRRLRPDSADWTRTRLFGAWQGAMDLPYDPLGM